LKQKNLLKLCKKVASGLSTSFFQKILTFFRGNSEKRSSDGKQQQQQQQLLVYAQIQKPVL
jgi:hypothetical protein